MSATDGRVLITGASGYLGSRLARRLADDGVPLRATARRQCGVVADQLAIPVEQLDVMGALPSFEGVETLVHCATPNDIDSSAEDAGLPLAVLGTRRLLDHAVAAGVRRVVFLSTLQVYGTELAGEITEETPPRLEKPYGLNHLLGEEVCRYFATAHGLDVVALRPSNVFGVPLVSTVDRWTLVPMCFVRDAMRDDALTLRSSGRQVRNFVSTAEVADLIARLIANFPSGYSIVNAASNWNTTVHEIATMVQEAWQTAFGRPLRLTLLSDEPARSNFFTVASRYEKHRPTPEQSRGHMAETIAGLIQLIREQDTQKS